MVINEKRILPSVDFVDAYKDRLRQLEIENKRMRGQLGLNQHRPIGGTLESDLNRVSTKLAHKTEKMKEVVAYARSLETKYNDNKEEIDELKEKNSSLELELKKIRFEKQNKEDCLMYELEELKKSLRKQEREQKKRKSSMEEKLKFAENEKQQFKDELQKQKRFCAILVEKETIAQESRDGNAVFTKPAAGAKQTRVLAPLRSHSSPDVTSPLVKARPDIESRPAPLRRSLTKPDAAATKADVESKPTTLKPLKGAIMSKSDVKSSSSLATLKTSSAPSVANVNNECKPVRGLSPLSKKSSSLTSLADLPAFGQKQPKTTKGKKKSGKKTKAVNMSNFHDDVESILDSLL